MTRPQWSPYKSYPHTWALDTELTGDPNFDLGFGLSKCPRWQVQVADNHYHIQLYVSITFTFGITHDQNFRLQTTVQKQI